MTNILEAFSLKMSLRTSSETQVDLALIHWGENWYGKKVESQRIRVVRLLLVIYTNPPKLFLWIWNYSTHLLGYV